MNPFGFLSDIFSGDVWIARHPLKSFVLYIKSLLGLPTERPKSWFE